MSFHTETILCKRDSTVIAAVPVCHEWRCICFSGLYCS